MYSFSEKVKYMSDANNALAALGLDVAAAPVEQVVETVTETVADTTTEQVTETTAPVVETTDEDSFTVGAEELVSFDAIPALERGFSSTKSKYGAEDIAAPGENGNKYNGKLIKYAGGDADKFKRSVQSSVTGQNAKAKDAGAPNYYVSRTHEVGGEFIGVYIIRTDERPAPKAEAAPAVAEGTAAE